MIDLLFRVMGEELGFVRPDIIAGELDFLSFRVPGQIAELHDGLIGGQVDELRTGRLQKQDPKRLVRVGRTQAVPRENIVDREQLYIHITVRG